MRNHSERHAHADANGDEDGAENQGLRVHLVLNHLSQILALNVIEMATSRNRMRALGALGIDFFSPYLYLCFNSYLGFYVSDMNSCKASS